MAVVQRWTILQVHQETTEIQQAPAGLHVHQEVDVAPFPCLTTRYRPEHPNLAGSVETRQLQNRLAVPAQLDERWRRLTNRSFHVDLLTRP